MTEQNVGLDDPQLAVAALGELERSSKELALVRVGTNAVYVAGEVVVRVAPTDYDQQLLRDQIDLAHWLVDRGFPTAGPLSDIVIVQGHPVTVWERIPESRKATMRELGVLARLFHDMTDDYSGRLPVWEPLGRLGDRLDELLPDEVVTKGDCELLHYWKTRLVADVSKLAFSLPPGPIHGDIHGGNVVANEFGCSLIDFDRIARGPREWDLADPLAGVVLFSSGEFEWDQFVAEYGFDLRQHEGAQDLVMLRGLFMLSWLLNLKRTPSIEAEIRRRMEFFRDPTGPHQPWSPV